MLWVLSHYLEIVTQPNVTLLATHNANWNRLSMRSRGNKNICSMQIISHSITMLFSFRVELDLRCKNLTLGVWWLLFKATCIDKKFNLKGWMTSYLQGWHWVNIVHEALNILTQTGMAVNVYFRICHSILLSDVKIYDESTFQSLDNRLDSSDNKISILITANRGALQLAFNFLPKGHNSASGRRLFLTLSFRHHQSAMDQSASTQASEEWNWGWRENLKACVLQ